MLFLNNMQKFRNIITIKIFASLSLLISLFGMMLWIVAASQIYIFAGSHYPMQFNTALCIALSSISILSLPSRKKLALILSQFANLLAALTFAQYLTDMNFRIDDLFGYMDLNVTYPGRMAPNTALCLILLNTALLMHLKCHSRIIRFTQLALVCVVFGLTFLSSISHFLEIRAVYLWSGLTAMSIQTALGIIFLSSSLIMLFLLHFRRFYVGLIETIAIVVIGTLASILFWQFLYMDFEYNVQKKIQNEAMVVSNEIKTVLGSQAEAARRFFYRVSDSPIDDERIKKDAVHYLEDMPSLVYIQWQANQGLMSNSSQLVMNQAEMARFCDNAPSTNSGIRTVISRKPSNNHYFLCLLSANDSNRLMLFDFTKFLSDTINSLLPRGFNLRISDNQHILFERLSAEPSNSSNLRFADKLEVHSFAGELRFFIWPSNNYLRSNSPVLPDFFLFFGLIITGLLAFINYLKHSVNMKNEKLRNTMQNRNQQLSEMKAKYERIYEYSPDMLLFIDTGNLITECNETFVDSMGYFRKNGVLGRSLFDVLHLKDKKIKRDIAKILADRGAIKNLELSLTNLNGEESLVMLKASPFLNEEKEFLGYSFSLRDISDINALKQELMAREYSVNLFRENIALYDHILDETTDGWWDINLETKECRLSKKLLRSLGLDARYSHSHVNFFREHVIPEDFAIVENNLKQHLISKGRFPFKQEVRYRHQNGKLVWIFCRGQGILDPDGKIRRVVGTHVDISALKLTQAKLSKKIKEMDLIDQSTHLVLMSDDIDTALRNCLSLIGLTTPFSKGILYRYHPAANVMVATAIWSKKEIEPEMLGEGEFPPFSLAYGEGLAGRAWQEGKSQLSRVDIEKFKAVLVNKWNKLTLNQVIAVPLFLSDKVECIFEFYPTKKLVINENELGLFDILATQLSLALERKKADYLLKHLALHDELTQLPNRRACLEMLEMSLSRAKRSNSRFALMFLDLDGFKQVNDSFGHHIGDLLLIEVSQLFRKAIRKQDYLARLAGDEFIIIVNDLLNQEMLAVLANRLIQSLSRPLVLENNIVKVSVSIGCVTYPEAGQNIEDLLRGADYAMYKVKQGGKNSFSGLS